MAVIQNDTPFARSLRALRERKGVTLRDVAGAVGTSRTHIWQLETGRRTNPTLDLLKRLGAYFEVSLSVLVGEASAPQENAAELIAQIQQFTAMTQEDRQRALHREIAA